MLRNAQPRRGCSHLAGMLRAGSVLLLALALASCSGGSRGTPAPAINSFSGSPATITAGSSATLTGVFANGTGVIMPGGLSTTSGAAQTVTPDATTTYTLSVTNDGGTKVSQTATVTVVAAPSVPVISAPAYATAGSAGLRASVPVQDGSSCAWSITGGTITAGDGTSEIAFTAGTLGTVQLGCVVTNAAGTAGSPGSAVSAIVPAPSLPVISAPATVPAATPGLVASVPAQAASTYAWTITGGTITAGADSNQITYSAGSSGSVQLACVVTNAAGTASPQGSATSAILVLPVISSFTAAKSPVTTGSATTLSAVFSGGTGSIDQGIGGVASGAAVPTGILSASRTYTLTVTNGAGMSVTAQVPVAVVAAPIINSFSAAKSPVTAGSATSLSAVFTGGSGAVDQGIGTVTSGAAVSTGILAASLSYTLTVTNPAGSSVTAQVPVAVVAAPVITSFSAAKSPLTAGSATSLSAVYTGGTGAVDQGLGAMASGAAVSTGSLSASLTYTLTVTNDAGSSATAQAPVQVVAAPVISSFSAAAPSIYTGMATTLTAAFSGGTGSIDSGIGPVTTGVAVPTGNLSAGLTYTLTVTNTAGTSASAQATVTVSAAPPPSVTSFSASRPSVGPGAGVTLTASFTGGTGVINPGAISLPASGPVSVSPAVSTSYVLTVSGPGGPDATASTRVVVGSLGTFAGTPSGVGNTSGTGSAARLYGPEGSAYDASGNLYVTDQYNHVIRRIDGGTGAVTVLAGTMDRAGSADGSGTAASFNWPTGIAVALAGPHAGNIFVADTGNNLIRMITPTGTVTTFAGTDAAAGYFHSPRGLAVDGAGTVWVADTDNNTIRKITTGGAVSTFAGITGTAGHADSSNPLTATFNQPYAVAVDSAGYLYVADTYNHIIRLITPAGVVTTYAGVWTGAPGNADGSPGGFWVPMGIALDSAGTVYVADTGNQIVRTLTARGKSDSGYSPYVNTVIGHNTDSNYGDGAGLGVEFSLPPDGVYFDWPTGVALNAAGTTLVVSDSHNNAIRVVPVVPGLRPASTAMTSTWAGFAHWDGIGWLDSGFTYPPALGGGPQPARFNAPGGLALDSAGNVYLADTNNHSIRKISAAGTVSTFAGTPAAGHPGTVPVYGSTDGALTTAAQFDSPGAVAVDNSTLPTAGHIYVADTGNNKVRMIAGGIVSTIASGLNVPLGIAVDSTSLGSAGRIYVADTFNNVIRTIPPGGGTMTILAGSGSVGSVNGVGTAASFYLPGGIAVDNSTLGSAGTIYVADTYNNLIRRITMPGGTVSTLAGSGLQGFADGIGAAAEFNHPGALAVDPATGNLYIADTYNQVVRMLVPGTGAVTTLVGVAATGIFPLAFPAALPASLAFPSGIAVAPGLTLGGANPGGSLLISAPDAVLAVPF